MSSNSAQKRGAETAQQTYEGRLHDDEKEIREGRMTLGYRQNAMPYGQDPQQSTEVSKWHARRRLQDKHDRELTQAPLEYTTSTQSCARSMPKRRPAGNERETPPYERNNDRRSSQFLNHLSSYPIVSDGIETFRNGKTYVELGYSGPTRVEKEYETTRTEKAADRNVGTHRYVSDLKRFHKMHGLHYDSTTLSTQTGRRSILRPQGSYPTIPGWIKGKKVNPLGDSGASYNYVSESYARRNGYTIDQAGEVKVKMANSAFADIVGSTMLRFNFKHDSKTYDIQFKVLRNCIHDMILGAKFLRLTETFTRFKERITWKISNLFKPSVNFMNDCASQQYIHGFCNNVPVVALPDTGSQVQLISERHAQAMGYKLLREAQHKIKLQLADGSVVYTEGMVQDLDWKYEAYGETYRENFYVLKDLACDVILSCDFVCDTQALEDYAHLLFDSDLVDADIQANLSIIKIVPESKPDSTRERFQRGLKSIFSKPTPQPVAATSFPAVTELEAFEKEREAILDAIREVRNKPPDERAAREQALHAEYEEFMKKKPPLPGQINAANSSQAP